MIPWQRRACRRPMRERDTVLLRGGLRDDDALARVAIDGGRVHFRRRPARLAVAGEERREALGGGTVHLVVCRQRRMPDHAPRGQRAVGGGGVDLLCPLLAGIGLAHRRRAGKEARKIPEEVELGAHALEVPARHRRAGVRAGRRPDDHVGQCRRVDAVLKQAMKEAAVPGEIVGAAAAENERAVEAVSEG